MHKLSVCVERVEASGRRAVVGVGAVGGRRSDEERQEPCGEAEPVMMHVRDFTPAPNRLAKRRARIIGKADTRGKKKEAGPGRRPEAAGAAAQCY